MLRTMRKQAGISSVAAGEGIAGDDGIEFGAPGLESLTQLCEIACSQDPIEEDNQGEALLGNSQQPTLATPDDFIAGSQDENGLDKLGDNADVAVDKFVAGGKRPIWECNPDEALQAQPRLTARGAHLKNAGAANSSAVKSRMPSLSQSVSVSNTAALPARLTSASLNKQMDWLPGTSGINAPDTFVPAPQLGRWQEGKGEPVSDTRATEKKPGRRGPMDEMRQLVRILCRMLPNSTQFLDVSEGEGGGNRTSEDQIKHFLNCTLGDAPRPRWGVPDGWGNYLAEIFAWATGKIVAADEAKKCFKRDAGRPWEAVWSTLITDLGLYTHMWPLPLTKEGVREAQELGSRDPELANAPLAKTGAFKRGRESTPTATGRKGRSKAQKKGTNWSAPEEAGVRAHSEPIRPGLPLIPTLPAVPPPPAGQPPFSAAPARAPTPPPAVPAAGPAMVAPGVPSLPASTVATIHAALSLGPNGSNVQPTVEQLWADVLRHLELIESTLQLSNVSGTDIHLQAATRAQQRLASILSILQPEAAKPAPPAMNITHPASPKQRQGTTTQLPVQLPAVWYTEPGGNPVLCIRKQDIDGTAPAAASSLPTLQQHTMPDAILKSAIQAELRSALSSLLTGNKGLEQPTLVVPTSGTVGTLGGAPPGQGALKQPLTNGMHGLQANDMSAPSLHATHQSPGKMATRQRARLANCTNNGWEIGSCSPTKASGPAGAREQQRHGAAPQPGDSPSKAPLDPNVFKGESRNADDATALNADSQGDGLSWLQGANSQTPLSQFLPDSIGLGLSQLQCTQNSEVIPDGVADAMLGGASQIVTASQDTDLRALLSSPAQQNQALDFNSSQMSLG